jgi:hypothetical protein
MLVEATTKLIVNGLLVGLGELIELADEHLERLIRKNAVKPVSITVPEIDQVEADDGGEPGEQKNAGRGRGRGKPKAAVSDAAASVGSAVGGETAAEQPIGDTDGDQPPQFTPADVTTGDT